MSNYLESAFHAVIEDAKTPETWYVSLVESYQRYGGPEEGGWWTTDSVVISYKEFSTEEAANLAKEAVEKLAEELTAESRKDYGEQMLRSMEWLDDRGLDADFLPEPDGESTYSVVVSKGIPSNSYGPTHYE
jgi:hypothetical protein